MSGFIHRFNEWLTGRERAANEARTEFQSLHDELVMLENEARFQSEPSYAAYAQQKRDELEKETRVLFYLMTEPQRSALQGRCQRLLEEIERPGVVEVRIGEVKERLVELRKQVSEAESESPSETGERAATA